MFMDASSLVNALKKYPAGKFVAVALNKDNEICPCREVPFRILPVTSIVQTDTYVYLEYSEAYYGEHIKNVHEILSAIEVTGTLTDIKSIGQEFKQGILSLFGKYIPDKQYRIVQVMLRGTRMSDFQQIFDISVVQLHQDFVCLFD